MDHKEFKNLVKHKMLHSQDQLKKELLVSARYKKTKKDILIVVKDQLEYVKQCIESIYENTEDFNLYVWDNDSKPETSNYLNELMLANDNVELCKSSVNEGFIVPNNALAARTKSPYIILLNSDTLVRPGWDKALIGWLQQEGDDAAVGYMGSKLNEEGKGGEVAYGYDADYICGWCLCFSRKTYEEHGLFDEENLEFAYGEDADYSLRLKEAGKQVYALHLDLVLHFENKTSLQLQKEGFSFKEAFDKNHAYIKQRWTKPQQGS